MLVIRDFQYKVPKDLPPALSKYIDPAIVDLILRTAPSLVSNSINRTYITYFMKKGMDGRIQ